MYRDALFDKLLRRLQYQADFWKRSLIPSSW